MMLVRWDLSALPMIMSFSRHLSVYELVGIMLY
jgi:hypothetical protein